MSDPRRTLTIMDEDYLATRSLYQWAIGQTIDFHLTWPGHPRFTVGEGDGVVTATAPTGEQRGYRTGEWTREQAVEDVRRFILDHANVQGLKRGKHTTWRGAEWCKIPQ